MATRTLKGYLLIATALVACPCWLPVWAALIAGTALGAVLEPYLGLLGIVAGLYFVVAVVIGWRIVEQRKEASADGD